jgi:hypothetical protein
MKEANCSDRKKVVRIICESFDKNPHINYLVKNDNKRSSRMTALAEYAFELGIRRDGIWLTDDDLGVVIIYQNSKVRMNYYECWLQFCLIFKTFSVPRALKVNKLESMINKNRAAGIDFLYVWFFGVANEGLGTNDGRDLMNYVFNLSYNLKLPVYVETTIKRNNIIFKRFGFEDYKVLKTGIEDLTFWYMKRPAYQNLN